MTRKTLFVLPVLLGVAATAVAQPLDPFNPRRPAGAGRAAGLPDLDKPIPGTLQHPHPYDIHPEAGAYAICVMSYMGPTAGPLAFDLVSELRQDYRLPAYFFNRTEEARRQEKERLEAQRRQRWERYQQAGIEPPETVVVKKVLHIDAQYAVLIADKSFKDMDIARAHLERIRKLKPPSDRLLNLGQVVPYDGDGKWAGTAKQAYINPFTTAFVVPNPTVPRQAPPPGEAEDWVAGLKHMNSAEEYSLFKCPGQWTLVVKSYQGATTIVSKDSEKSVLERIGFGGNQNNLLDAAAKQAHQLAEILRNPQLNFDSYVLHMKNLSIVTVGSFDSEKDPRMHQLMAQLSKLRLEPYETLQPPTPFRVPKK